MAADIHFFYPPTFSRIFASQQAPEVFAQMFNILGHHFTTQASDIVTMGVLSVPLIKKRMAIVLTLEKGYQAGELMDLSLRYLDTQGVDVEVAAGQLNSVDTPDPGSYTEERDIPDIPAGRVLRLERDYQPGPGPKNEHMTLLLQLF